VVTVSSLIINPLNPLNPLYFSITYIYNSNTGRFFTASIIDIYTDYINGDIIISRSLFKKVVPGINIDIKVSVK